MRIHPAGFSYVALGLIAALLSAPYSLWLAGTSLSIALFFAFFFRDPERKPPDSEGKLLSPADGKIVETLDSIDRRNEGAAKYDAFFQAKIYLSLLDVHVIRAPCGGTIRDISKFPGRHLPANWAISESENEHYKIVISGGCQQNVTLSLTAGLIARQISLTCRVGQEVKPGERIGIIRFGSRAGVRADGKFRPNGIPGDRVRAGETIIATLDSECFT